MILEHIHLWTVENEYSRKRYMCECMMKENGASKAHLTGVYGWHKERKEYVLILSFLSVCLCLSLLSLSECDCGSA